MKTVKEVAESLVNSDVNDYTPDLIGTIPKKLQDSIVSRDTLLKLMGARELRSQEFADQLNLDVSSEELNRILTNPELAKEMGCLVTATRTQFFNNLTACVAAEILSAKWELEKELKVQPSATSN